VSAAPSCAFLGDGAASLALKAVRRTAGASGASAVLVRWGCLPGRGGASAGLRPALRAEARRLQDEVPEGWCVGLDGRVITVDVEPVDAVAGRAIEDFVATYAGAVAVAIGACRCDAVDDVLRMVDEVVVIEPAVRALRAMVAEELTPVAARLAIVPPPRSALSVLIGGQGGQTTIVAIAVVATLLAIAAALGIVASALGHEADAQGRGDVAALAGAKALLTAQPLLYSADPAQRISAAEYRLRGQRATERSATANHLRVQRIELLGDPDMPTRIRVTALSVDADAKHDRVVKSTAEVALAAIDTSPGVGDYQGPLAVRQGQRMRPDVALAFDRMNAAATAAGHPLVIVSGYRSDAEQAVLFAQHPDPKWVAPPGKSLHRLGTELDLGPNAAYGWLAANCGRFGFLKRYPWEPWHFGYIRNAGSTSLGYTDHHDGAKDDDPGDATTGSASKVDRGPERASGSAIPSFVPGRFAPMISAAAQRWSVGAALLGAQLSVESQFNPNAVSGAGAAGIAQFMPGTGLMYGLTPAERFDPAKAIDAQGHLMHDLLSKFGSVPLALAAYNAGDGAVSACMCVPNIPETQGYVQKILALLGGAGLAAPAGLQIRLVE
jgi:hypothetical protein